MSITRKRDKAVFRQLFAAGLIAALTVILWVCPASVGGQSANPPPGQGELTAEQEVAIDTMSEYLWGPHDPVSQELEKLGFKPVKNTLLADEWPRMSAAEKVGTAVAAATAQVDGVKNANRLLALLIDRLAEEYDPIAAGREESFKEYQVFAETDSVIQTYLKLPPNTRGPPPVKFGDMPRKRTRSQLPATIAKAVEAIGSVLEHATLGSAQSVLCKYFYASDQRAEVLLRESPTLQDAMKAALEEQPVGDWDGILSRLTSDLIETVPAAREEKNLSKWLPEQKSVPVERYSFGWTGMESGFQGSIQLRAEKHRFELKAFDRPDPADTWNEKDRRLERLERGLSGKQWGNTGRVESEFREIFKGVAGASILADQYHKLVTLEGIQSCLAEPFKGTPGPRFASLEQYDPAALPDELSAMRPRLKWLQAWLALARNGDRPGELTPAAEQAHLATLSLHSDEKLAPIIRQLQVEASVRTFLRGDTKGATGLLPSTLPQEEAAALLDDVKTLLKGEGKVNSPAAAAGLAAATQAGPGIPKGINDLLPQAATRTWATTLARPPPKTPTVLGAEFRDYAEAFRQECLKHISSHQEEVEQYRAEAKKAVATLRDGLKEQSQKFETSLNEVEARIGKLTAAERRRVRQMIVEGTSVDAMLKEVSGDRDELKTFDEKIARADAEHQKTLMEQVKARAIELERINAEYAKMREQSVKAAQLAREIQERQMRAESWKARPRVVRR